MIMDENVRSKKYEVLDEFRASYYVYFILDFILKYAVKDFEGKFGKYLL
jgi:hypothetical protein